MSDGKTFTEQPAEWATPYRFIAKELDEETGLYYCVSELVRDIEMSRERAKRSSYPGAQRGVHAEWYYDPRVSMWWGVDPLAEKYPSYSPYTYTLNNPVMYIDPDGRSPFNIIVGRQPREGQKDLVTIKFTADILNTSNLDLTPDQLSAIGKTIGDQIIESFGKAFENFDVNVDVAFDPINSWVEVKDNHLIRIEDYGNTDFLSHEGDVGGSVILGSTLVISSSIIDNEKQLARTGAHEFGHLVGLYHPDDQRNKDKVPEANKDRKNLMHQSNRTSGTNIIQEQIESILNDFNNE